MAVSFLPPPARGAVFGWNGQTNSPPGCPFGGEVPLDKTRRRYFPRAALPRTPSGCLTTQVTERRAEGPPPRVSLKAYVQRRPGRVASPRVGWSGPSLLLTVLQGPCLSLW